MLIEKFVLGYFLIVIGVISLLEFFNMNLIISKKNHIKQLTINLIFISFIFSFCSFFFIFSYFIHLKILIFIILSTCIASDIGGFIFGKLFKGTKLTKISPNKTISGAIGSIIFSSSFTLLSFYYLTNNLDPFYLIIGITTSISAQCGDLFFSYLKRKSYLKDTGNFLPGHGGILDRIDGILLGLPVGFLTLLLY